MTSTPNTEANDPDDGAAPQQAGQQEQPQAPQYQAPQYAQPQYAQQNYGQQSFGQPPYVAPGYLAQPQYPYAATYGAPGPGGPFDGATDPEDLSRPLYGATFGQAVRRFFKGYAKFTGRASRSEYWWVALFVALVQLVPTVLLFFGLLAMVATSRSYSYGYDYGYSDGFGDSVFTGGALAMFIVSALLFLIIALALLVPSFAIGWRRMHDANFAGPLYLISLGGAIPYVGFAASIAVIVLTVLPSKVEGRRFDTPVY